MQESKDAMTDAITRSVLTRASTGESLTLMARADSSIWLAFHLGRPDGPSLSARRSFAYRVDQQRARDANSFSDVLWEGRYVAMLVWEKSRPLGVAALGELLEGTQLLARYRLSTGEHIDTTFSLAGLAEAATALMDVEAIRSAAGQQNRRAAAMTTCMANAVNEDYATCMRRLAP